jgi:predicted transcriptional regulator of viral defense system
MRKYIDIIRNKINSFQNNYVFISKDFISDVDYETVRKTLSRLCEKSEIKKISRGYYYKPIYLSIINDYSRPNIDSYAKAIARNMNWKIFPTGNTALNEFGLSTQVPSNYSYISSGRTISYEVDKIVILFTHRSSRETDFSYITGTVIQALKAIGQDNITDEIINKISSRLLKEEKKLILLESKNSSAWIYEMIKLICKEPQND